MLGLSVFDEFNNNVINYKDGSFGLPTIIKTAQEVGNLSRYGVVTNKKVDEIIDTVKSVGNIVTGGKAPWFGLTAMQARAAYQKAYSLGAILQSNYAIYVNDIFNIGGGKIPWFANDFPLSWLATEAEISLGGLDAENFYAGSYQNNYFTQQTADTIDVTFIETRDMHIANSCKACLDLITPNDGTIKEPKFYTFELIVSVLGQTRNLQNPKLNKRYLVAVKDATFSLSSTGRSEIIKIQVIFQKIRDYDLFRTG